MTLLHERYVASRFDALEARFHEDLPAEDLRLAGIVAALGRVDGIRILDLGCGKGRFARRLIERGAEVIGLDPSAGMLAKATGLDRVRGSATRLPFATQSFDAVIAVEVIEHLPAKGVGAALDEMQRVLKPGGRLAILDKNLLALDAHRPWLPKVIVKRIDERRGLWMYPQGSPVRERWFRPEQLARSLRSRFARVSIRYLLSPQEAKHAVFRRVARTRLMTLWLAEASGGTS